jgi:hypothetical protein
MVEQDDPQQMKMPGPGSTINASPKNDHPLQELAPHCPLQKGPRLEIFLTHYPFVTASFFQ